MRDDRALVALGDLVDINPREEPLREDAPFIPMDAVSDGCSGVIRYVEERGSRGGPRFRSGDTLFARITPCLENGKVALVPESIERGSGSTEFLVLRPKAGILPQFVFVLSTWGSLRREAARLMTGTSGRQRLSGADLGKLLVPALSLEEQRRIVDLISSIDHAIWAAEMTMEAAHSAAREFLRQAFTQLTGRQSTLGDIAFYINGYPFKPQELGSEGVPVIRIKQLLNPNEVPDRTTVDVPDRHRISDGDLIFSWSGTLATKMWDRGPAILNQHLSKVVEREGIDRAWLRLALEHAIEQLETMTHGTTMKHITKAKMMPYPVVVPPIETQRKVAAQYEVIELVAVRASSAVEHLKRLRTGMLADLLSGTHQIPDSYDRFLDQEVA